jgi:hypothetical protein
VKKRLFSVYFPQEGPSACIFSVPEYNGPTKRTTVQKEIIALLEKTV